MGYKILAINPGSTSTKVALYDEERPLLELNLRHSTEEISRFAGVNDQLDWRRGLILSALREEAFDIRNLSAVIGRGGLIRPIPAGVYEVNSRMRYDLRNAQMKHACNLGGLLAAQIAHMAVSRPTSPTRRWSTRWTTRHASRACRCARANRSSTP